MRNRRGFTLVEVLVTLGLVVAVSALMFTFVLQGLSLYTVESREADEQSNLREVLSDITNRARLSTAITYENGVLSITDRQSNQTRYSFDASGKRILRNGATLATSIGGFTVTKTTTMLNINITGVSGAAVSTSLSLTG